MKRIFQEAYRVFIFITIFALLNCFTIRLILDTMETELLFGTILLVGQLSFTLYCTRDIISGLEV